MPWAGKGAGYQLESILFRGLPFSSAFYFYCTFDGEAVRLFRNDDPQDDVDEDAPADEQGKQ